MPDNQEIDDRSELAKRDPTFQEPSPKPAPGVTELLNDKSVTRPEIEKDGVTVQGGQTIMIFDGQLGGYWLI